MKTPDIKSFVKGIGRWANKNSPVILAGIGIAGLVATAVAATKATIKATKIVEERKQTALNPVTKKEIVAATWKLYIPTAIIAAGSIACIIGGTVQGQKRLAAISALYSMSEQALKEYKEATKEVVGEKNADKVADKVAENKMAVHKCPDELILNTGKGNTLFYDSWNGRYFRSDIDVIKRIVNDLNSSIIHGDAVSANSFYAEVGIPLILNGDEIGWDCEALMEFSYRPKLNDKDEPCIALDYTERPRYLWS